MLTIYIPTYNRLRHIQLLVESLIQQIDDLLVRRPNFAINLIVSNNASIDGTLDYLVSIDKWYFKLISHEPGIVGDENIRLGFDVVDSGYLWILGDDDMPTDGLVSFLAVSLERGCYDIIALKTVWVKNLLNIKSFEAAAPYELEVLTGIDFMRLSNVKLTFISSFIVNMDRIKHISNDVRWDVVRDSSFNQLAPLAALLKNGRNFAAVKQISILATGNTHFHYSLLRVFGLQLSRIVSQLFSYDERFVDIFHRKLLIAYLPGFVYKSKFSISNSLDRHEIPWGELDAEYRRRFLYWVFVRPLKSLGKWPSLVCVVMGRLYR